MPGATWSRRMRTVQEKINAVPVQPSERISELDILRGIALFGILIVNMSFFKYPIFFERYPSNFPEGMATFYSALVDVRLGIAIAVAIAIHNIPEGLAVSAPIYKATGSKKKAFLWSFLSGIAEPAGALFTAAFLLPFLNAQVLGMVLAAIAGVMVFISIDELVPVSRSYGFEHLPVLGFIAGMIVMAASLLLIGK